MGFKESDPAIQAAVRKGLVAGLEPLAAKLAKARRKPRAEPDWMACSDGSWFVRLRPACRVVSEANRRDHWAVRRRRFKKQAESLQACLLGCKLWMRLGPGEAVAWTPPLPCTITLTHVGRTMDTDNLAGAFKGLRDAIANEWLNVDDGDARVTWKYDQSAGEPGVVITIEGR